MPQQYISLAAICEQTGVSDRSARRYLEGESINETPRSPGTWNRFKPEEVPRVVALIASKRQRKRRNAFNSVFLDEVATQ